METTRKRFEGPDAVGNAVFAEASASAKTAETPQKEDSGGEKVTPETGKRPSPDTDSPEEPEVGRKRPRRGRDQRAKGDPALSLDRDPSDVIGASNDGLLQYLQQGLESDKVWQEKQAEANKMQAEAAKVQAEAALVAAEALREKSQVKLVAANTLMLQAIIAATEKGIAVPSALLEQLAASGK